MLTGLKCNESGEEVISKHSNTRKMILIYGTLCVLGVLYYYTRFFMTGIPHYDPEDTFFHLNRLMGLENVWTSPVNFLSFGKNGNYVNLFYPWLTMYPMWILYKIFGSYVIAYKLYYMLLSIATLIIAYRCFRRMVLDDTAAVCFAILYSFSSYRFANVFRRAALGEAIAMTFLPVILLGTFLVFFDDYNSWRVLTIGIALTAYTHVLSLLLAGVIFFVVFLVSFYWWNHKRERIVSCFKSVLFAAGLSLGVFAPMLQAMRCNEIYTPEGGLGYLVDHLDNLAVILGNSISNIPTAHSIGLLSIIALVGAFFILLRTGHTGSAGDCAFIEVSAGERNPSGESAGRRNFSEKSSGDDSLPGEPVRHRALAWLFAVVGLAILISSSSVMPWALIFRSPKLSIIQFPWRLNAYSTLFISAAFSVALIFVRGKIRRITVLVAGLLALFLTWSSVVALHQEEQVRLTDETVREMHTPTMDYAPKQAVQDWNVNGYTFDYYYLDGEMICPGGWITPDGGSLRLDLESAVKGQVLDVPVFWFTTVKAKVNGEEIPTAMSDRGTVLIMIPADGKVSVEVYHVYSNLTWCAWGVSFVLFVILVVTGCRKRIRRRRSMAS